VDGPGDGLWTAPEKLWMRRGEPCTGLWGTRPGQARRSAVTSENGPTVLVDTKFSTGETM
jgi:hypothetical protein